MSHPKDYRQFPAHWARLAERFMAGRESVEYETIRKSAEYDRAMFYAFRSAVKKVQEEDKLARSITAGLEGSKFYIHPARTKESKESDVVRVKIVSWIVSGEHPLDVVLEEHEEREMESIDRTLVEDTEPFFDEGLEETYKRHPHIDPNSPAASFLWDKYQDEAAAKALPHVKKALKERETLEKLHRPEKLGSAWESRGFQTPEEVDAEIRKMFGPLGTGASDKGTGQ